MILGQLGRAEEAQIAVAETIKLKPDFAKSVRADLRRRSIPDDRIEHMIDGLGKSWA